MSLSLQAQPKKSKFQQELNDLVKRIDNIKVILQQTESKKQVSIGQLIAINKQVETNHALIKSLNQELETINQQLAQQLHKLTQLEKELAQLKKEYANMTYLGAKTMHDIHVLVFIFLADSFQEILQRLSALKQYAKLRQKHFQGIQNIRVALRARQKTLEQQGVEKNILLQTWRTEQNKLNNLKQQQTQFIAALEQQRTRLLQELQQKNESAKRLDHLITDIVKKETILRKQEKLKRDTVQDTVTTPLVTKAALANTVLTAAFAQKRGSLPWPVKTGFISHKFGIQPHEVLKNIQVENLGIDIQTKQGNMVYPIFKGTVKAVALVPGMNQVVIIQHGQYHSVYVKLKYTLVKVGQSIDKEEPIGMVYTNKNGITELQLQIWKGIQKLNPAGWLAPQVAGCDVIQ